jgi:uncharacterized cupredoxin-like copper-binding protein
MIPAQLSHMKHDISFPTLLATVLAATATITCPMALGHDNDQHQKPQQKEAAAGPAGNTPGVIVSTDEHAFGREGNPYKLTRTINIVMDDTMRFSPASVTIRQGDTIRFIVHNKGKLMHEMVLGTLDQLKAHGEMMKKHPGMEHDEPYMAHVQPGKREEIVWQFTKAGEFHYACLIAGHFEAGMIGNIKVTKG